MRSKLVLIALMLSSGLLSQTTVGFAPVKLNRSQHPTSLDYYEIASASKTVSEFSPSIALHTFFKPQWNWFLQSSLIGYSYRRYYRGAVGEARFGNQINYSRLDLATFGGIEYWSNAYEDHSVGLRLALSAGIWGRLVQTHDKLLNDGQPGMNARLGLNFPIAQNYLALFFNFGFRVNNGFYMPYYGLALSYDFAIAKP